MMKLSFPIVCNINEGVTTLEWKLVLKDQKVAVVTGSSTGIGFETCLLFAHSGIHTYATMRDLMKADLIKNIAEKERLPLKVVQMDVDKDDSVADCEFLSSITYDSVPCHFFS
jgi:NADP-dependent 3-hydroxy acid dehydrogenase YdfG